MDLEKLSFSSENIPAEYHNFDRAVFIFMDDPLQIYRAEA